MAVRREGEFQGDLLMTWDDMPRRRDTHLVGGNHRRDADRLRSILRALWSGIRRPSPRHVDLAFNGVGQSVSSRTVRDARGLPIAPRHHGSSPNAVLMACAMKNISHLKSRRQIYRNFVKHLKITPKIRDDPFLNTYRVQTRRTMCLVRNAPRSLRPGDRSPRICDCATTPWLVATIQWHRENPKRNLILALWRRWRVRRGQLSFHVSS